MKKIKYLILIPDGMADEKIPELTFEIIPDPQIAIDAKRIRQKKVLLYIVIALLKLFALYKTVSPYLAEAVFY